MMRRAECTMNVEDRATETPSAISSTTKRRRGAQLTGRTDGSCRSEPASREEADDRFNAVIIEIAEMAKEFACRLVAGHVAEDISQQLALDCLIRLRNGDLVIDRASLPALVRTMVRRRAVDRLRRAATRDSIDAALGTRVAEDATPSWMLPDVMFEECDLDLFYRRTLETLTPRARIAYTMVREHQMTYRHVADRLGLSTATVCTHVVAAQRRFRAGLDALGIPGRHLSQPCVEQCGERGVA